MKLEKPIEILVLCAAWVVTIAAVILGIAPRLSPALFAVFALLTLISLLGEKQIHDAWTIISNSPLALTFFAFAGYCLASATWSADFKAAGGKALLLAAIVLTCMLAERLLNHLSKHEVWRFARGIVIGVVIGLVFLSIEFLTNHLLTRTLMNETPMSAGKNGVAALDGLRKVARLNNFYFNNQVSALNIVFWPGLLLATMWRGIRLKRIATGLLIGLIITVTFMSDSESAKVALILGGITYFVAIYSPAILHQVATGLWGAAVVLVIPMVLFAYELDVQKDTSLPYSARDRLHIWHYSAVRVFETPFLGIGIRSTRNLTDDRKGKKQSSKSKGLHDRPGLHTHNSFLQTWHELGAVGAAFLLALGLLLLRGIKNMTALIRPYAYATFAASSSIAAFGFGMWQSWLMTTYAWAVIFLLIAMRYERYART